jgi:hypothetical protein
MQKEVEVLDERRIADDLGEVKVYDFGEGVVELLSVVEVVMLKMILKIWKKLHLLIVFPVEELTLSLI